tara:strand:- start:1378 stop:2433 length:1056 start_codon:yes stop_codon:yes gene_type:complete
MGTFGASQKMRMVGPEPPGTPDNFSATKSTTTPKAINLSWSAPSGPAVVDGYKLSRAGSVIATQTGTTYSDTGLAAYNTSYSYSVVAYNADGDSVTPATASATTNAQCDGSGVDTYFVADASDTGVSYNQTAGSHTSHTLWNTDSGVQQTKTVPDGCFKVRIRALSGGGGGYRYSYYVHQGSCYSGSNSGAGGGGAYIDNKGSVTPGSSVVIQAGKGGWRSYSGGPSGIKDVVAVYGGDRGSRYPSSNPGGYAQSGQSGATAYTAGDDSSGRNGGDAALDGTNPTGIGGWTHTGGADQPCGGCSGCTGPNAPTFGGGGGAGGTDSSSLYGEAAYAGGHGGGGYVWAQFSES